MKTNEAVEKRTYPIPIDVMDIIKALNLDTEKMKRMDILREDLERLEQR